MNPRNLLMVVAASVMLPGAAVGIVRSPDIGADADLIAVCPEFDACERQTSIIHGSGPDCVKDDTGANAASARSMTAWPTCWAEIGKLRATTPVGIQASIVGRLLVYLLRDSAALSGPPPMVVASDFDLLEACATFHCADADRAVSNAKPGWDGDEIDEISARWYRR